MREFGLRYDEIAKRLGVTKNQVRYYCMSGGISTGYKFAFNSRWGLDLNIGLGYAHLQYNKYYLGGEYVNFPLERKKTKRWIGPTKFGVNLTYNIFR